MAGYSDTRKLIIDTLMGRPAGTEIQPEDHQAFALALNDYIRNVELNSGNAFIGFAQSDTVPIQSNNGQCFYISTVPSGTNIVYANFIDYEGNPISVTTPPNKMAFVTLIWNTRNWDSQITIIETNWSQIFENNIAPNSIDSSKIIDGTIQSTDLNPNAFDNTLTKPDKIAPADVVGSKLTELLNYINGMEGGVNGFAEDTSFQPNYPEDVAATVIGVGPGTFTNMIGENGSAITVDSISVVIFFKAAGSTYWKYKTILPTVVIEGNVELGVKDYAQLQGKPSINGKELASGENSLEALGIQPKGDYATKAAVNAIQALIPATASADNQLADKDFVNSSIATATAEFKGSFTSLDELKATSGNLNDYAFYLHTDDVGNKVVDRYKWTTAGWLYEYTLNNSSFTAEQWAALNSAITATLVQSYNSHLKDTTIHITADERTKWNNKWDYNEETIKGVKVNAAGSADKLATARKIWGKYFDGSGNVSGDLTEVDNITASGKATIQGDIVCGGEVVAVAGEGTPAGVTDYSALTGKPSINGKELASGENSLSELGIQPAGDYITESLLNAKLDNYTTKIFVANNYAGKSALNNHIADSVKHITADERTAWNNKSDLTAEDVKNIKVNNAAHADSADKATSAGSADKLTNSRKIFGLPFDGTKDVVGGITADGDSVIRGNLNVTKDGIFGGEVVAIVGNAEPAGVTNYSQLQGKPSINGKELVSGNNTLDELGIQPKGDYTTASQLDTILKNYVTKVFASNNYASKSAVNDIQALIPATATADNQLADKDFVNSSIATATAEFRGSFTSLDDLKATSGNLNDYAFYLHKDSVGNSIVDRYKWTTAGWLYEYTLNNSSFTAEQWAALNSAITATLVQSYNSHLKDTTIHITSAERTAWNNKWDYNEETIKEVKVNAAVSADKLTSDAGTSAIPIYFKNGKPTQCIPSDLFSGFDNAYSSTGEHSLGITIAGYTQMVVVAYSTLSDKANKLATPRTLWGRPFDGSANVDGDLKDVGNITASGKATIQGGIISGGEVAAIVGDGTPAGVTDYSALTGKPQINGVTLVSGNNTLATLGIQAAGDYATNSGVTTLLADYATKTFVSNNYAGKTAFNNHAADTDIHITAAERTDWNAKWDYNEATIKAVKVTSASSADSVAWANITNKPSTFTPSAHTHTASDVSGLPTSLKNPYALTFGSKTYDGSAAATITASDLGALTAHQSIYAFTLQVNGTSKGTYNPTSAAKTINIAVPTKTSDITNNSGFITSASIPTALKNPYAVEIKANGVSLGTYDGSAVATFNLSAANVGAANKVHSHTASEISGLPTKLSAFTNDVGFITGITKSMVEGVLTGDITSHTHTFASLTSKPTTLSGYGITNAISTSGGTIEGNFGILVVKRNKSYASGIRFDNNDGVLGYIGITQGGIAQIWDASQNAVQIIHSGNYNSYAPTLTGTGASGTWGISISGNAASATKLQDNTAFTAWGQTFFENGKPKNVSGDLSMEWSKIYWNGDINGSYISSNGMNEMIYEMRDGHTFRVNRDIKLRITRFGNVLIGTSSDNNYKLDVNGKGHFSGDLIVDGEVSASVA